MGRLGEDFELGSVSDGALVSIAALSSSAPDLSGTWKEPIEETRRAILVPLRTILVSGLSLTTQRKLTQASVSKIRSCVAEYDFLPTSTTATVALEAVRWWRRRGDIAAKQLPGGELAVGQSE